MIGCPSLMILLGFLLCMHCTRNPFAEARQAWNLKEDDFTILTADIEVLASVQKEVEENYQIAAASALGFGGRKMMDIVQAVHPPTTHDSSATSIDGEEEEEDQEEEEKMITETTTMMTEKQKKKLLEASFEDEIVHLMHRDYVSKGPPKAKRRPPINNHEPIH